MDHFKTERKKANFPHKYDTLIKTSFFYLYTTPQKMKLKKKY